MLYLIALFSVLLFVLLNWQLCGSFSLKNFNFMSLVFYSILIFNVIGGVALGLNIVSSDLLDQARLLNTRSKGLLLLCMFMVLFPITILFLSKLFKFNTGKQLNDFSKAKVKLVYGGNDDEIFYTIVILAFFAMGAVLYVIAVLGGSNPLLGVFQGLDALILAQFRSFSKFEFPGNEWIKNLGFQLVQLLSFFAYAYWQTTKSKSWKWLFVILFIGSLYSCLYNLEKAPVIIYFLGLLIVRQYLGFRLKSFFKYGLIGFLMVIVMYVFFMRLEFSNKSLILESIFSRIFLTQIGTYYLHIEAFPLYHDYLNGSYLVYNSLPNWLTDLLFSHTEVGIRSSRWVIMIFYPSEILNNTAGYANSLFIAEAYGNFGFLGIVLSSFYVGAFIFFLNFVFVKIRKTPVLVGLYSYLTCFTLITLQGGFFDFIFSFSNVFLLFVMFLFWFLHNVIGGIRNRTNLKYKLD